MEKMQKLNEASIKGQNRKTGESFGMVIGSDKKNREGNFELTIRVMYSSRISAYKLTFNSNNELINILDYGYSMDGNPPDVKGSGSGKSVKLDKRKTITFIAKLTSPAFANKIYKHLQKVNESVNEGYGDWVKAKNLTDIIKLSKQKKNATFYVTDDNNSRIGTFYLKNGKFAKATTANPNYDLQRNKTKLKDRSDVIYKYKVDESVNEAYVVLYSPKKGVKPVTTAAYKDKKDAEKWAKDLGGITMIVKKKVKGIDEGKKRYYQKDGIGKAKYTISYHDGKKKHKDGSDFFDIQTFKNKKDLAKFVNTLHKGGYVYGFNESEDGVPQGYNPVVEDKKQIKDLVKKVKYEKIFYDVLSTIEKNYGKRKYRIWLEKSLKDFGENPKHYDYRTNAAIEEKLFQLAK